MSRPTRGETSSQTVLKARQSRGQLTYSEEVLWSALRDSRIQGIKFRRQHPFGPYVLDFFLEAASPTPNPLPLPTNVGRGRAGVGEEKSETHAKDK